MSNNINTLAANAGSIARLLAGVLGGILTSVGISADDGQLETIIGAVLVAAAGIWSLVKNAKAASAAQDAAKKAGVLVLLLAFGWMLTGCAVVHGKAGQSRYTGFACGEKTSSTLAGLNITESESAKGKITVERGVGVDQAGVAGTTDVGKLLGNLLLLGLQSQGVPVKAQAVAAEPADTDDAPAAEASSETDFDPARYSGSPGADGSGVYGKTSCAGCRAYRAAHPDIELIDIGKAENKAAMWAALRRLGYTGTSVSLPVAVTGTGFTQAAK